MRSNSWLIAAAALGFLLSTTAAAETLPRCDRLIAPGANLATAYAATPTNGTLCLGSGNYNIASTLAVAKGIKITGFPVQDPTLTVAAPRYMPSLTQTSPVTHFAISAGGVTIQGLNGTGTGKSTRSAPSNSCADPQFLTTSGGISDVAAIGNLLTNFNCAVEFIGTTRPVVTGNYAQGSSYVGFGCSACVGDSGQTIWSGNIAFNNGYGLPRVGNNSYPFVFSGPGGSPSVNFTLQNNWAIFDPEWQGLDIHGGTKIWFLNNFCLFPGFDTCINMPVASSSGATNPIIDVRANGNIIDRGSMALIDSVVMCSDGSDGGCGAPSTKVTGGQIIGNTIRSGAGNGCLIAASPPVTVSGNNGATPCNGGNGLPQEAVASITLSGWTDGTANHFTPGQPNHTVATINVNMSASDWGWKSPPGIVTIAGANTACGLRVVWPQLVQALAGSPAAVCNDFQLVATLPGMLGSPFTQGGFSIDGNAPGFFVATNGSDGNPGTFSSPFLTLGKCQAVVQVSSPKTCFLRAGTYTLPGSGMLLDTPDAGETWAVYPPDGIGSAVISGAALNPSTIAITLNPGATGVTFSGLKITAGAYIAVFSQANNAKWINNTIDGLGTSPWYGMDIYGDNLLVAGNTIKNLSGSQAFGIFFNLNGATNSSIRDNNIQCISHYGMYVGANSTGNLIARNQVIGIGHVGGTPPTCGAQQDPSGTGIDADASNGNLYVANTIQGVEGYTIVVSNGTANLIDGNTLQSNSDPGVTLNGGPQTVLVHNNVTSTVGFNLGDEHDTCPRTGTSNNLFVSNNTFNGTYEALYLTSTQNSTIQGNTGNIGVSVNGGPSPHYAAGVSVVNWTQDPSPPCAPVQNNINNTLRLNKFTSTATAAKYGILFELNQCSNSILYNIFWQFGTPGTAAIQNNCGGSQTALTGNQVSADATPLNSAPPIAHAGAGSIVGLGKPVTLDASGSRLITGGAVGITYSWAQLSGPAVILANANTIQATFTSPVVAKPTIMSFQVTANTGNGSTTDRVYIGVDPSL